MSQIVEYPCGVYLNQRAEDYQKDVGHGYTAIKQLKLEPIEWHEDSVYNPLRDEHVVTAKESEAFFNGTALHMLFLDGQKLYDATYGVMPDQYSHPDHLTTMKQLKAVLKAAKQPLGGDKDALVDRIVAAGLPAKILETEIRLFNRSGRRAIKRSVDAKIRRLHRMAMASAEELDLPGGSLTIAQALKGALTEVSVFWVDENDIRQRARFDVLKPNFSGDLKSITDWKKGDFNKKLLREIILRGYIIQAAHYDEARRQLRKAVAEGRVFGGTKAQRKLLERIARAEEWGWMWIFAKMDGAPRLKAVVLERSVTDPEKSIKQYTDAVADREQALMNFIHYRNYFGLDKAWVDTEVIWKPEPEDWPLLLGFGND